MIQVTIEIMEPQLATGVPRELLEAAVLAGWLYVDDWCLHDWVDFDPMQAMEIMGETAVARFVGLLALVEVCGDWLFFAEVFQLPRWNTLEVRLYPRAGLG